MRWTIRQIIKQITVAALTMISLVMSGLALNISSVSASNLSLNLTIADGSNTISLDIAPLGANGTFRTSDTSGNNITVYTNNYTGYTLGILAKTANSNALINQSDNTKTLPSITNLVSQSNYNDDTYAETNNLNNTWGYRPSKLYDSNTNTNIDNTDYLPAPTSDSDQTIIAKTSSANATNTSDPYNIAIGARVDNNTPPGAYTNTFVITAVANSISYTINYNQNTEDTVTNMPTTPQQEVVDSTTPTITLPNNKPTRDGYIFKGWCTVQVADYADCNGTEYQPGGSYDIDYTTNTTTLYARWGLPPMLWDKVVEEWTTGGSRVQTNDDNADTGIKTATITTANSGVFKYNSDVFGQDSDAEKEGGGKYDIYYFRGILDETVGNYGSDGDGKAWPNYVRLGDTCWRIVRTTGSGGIKMIYNGLYSGGTTANSCANATTDAQVVRSYFNNNAVSNTYTSLNPYNIHAIGYTYNSSNTVTGVTTSSSNTTVAKVFGTSSDNGYNVNSSDSIIKQYIEKTWFTSDNGISAYESILEPNAGYCNDRSLYPSGSYGPSSLLSESTQIVPYGTSNMTAYYFGAYTRNYNSAQAPSFGCPRGIVDIYSTTTASGGNGQLDYPVALLTVDEASFAGSGNFFVNGSSFHANSYLRSGSDFWTLSPNVRYLNGMSFGFSLYPNGHLNNYHLNGNIGVRPVISLGHETAISSGAGTAIDPFVISPPSS